MRSKRGSPSSTRHWRVAGRVVQHAALRRTPSAGRRSRRRSPGCAGWPAQRSRRAPMPAARRQTAGRSRRRPRYRSRAELAWRRHGHDARWRAEQPAHRVQLVAEGQHRPAAQVAPRAVAGGDSPPRDASPGRYSPTSARAETDRPIAPCLTSSCMPRQAGVKAQVVADHELPLGCVGLVEQLGHAVERVPDRLFDQHVRARPQRLARRLDVQAGRIGHQHHVGLLVQRLRRDR